MALFDSQRYAELLAHARPAVIDSESEHDRLLGVAEALMEKGSSLSPEEEKLLELVVFLIESFERSIEEEEEDEEADEGESETAKPHETLQRLLQSRGLETQEIAHFFGNPHAAAEALAGRRPISRGQAKELGQFFRVPAKLFLS